MRGSPRGGHIEIRAWAIALILMSGFFLLSAVGAAERNRPFRIGALTTSWGPTPQMAAMRDGLVALGYREETDFVLGVRFTRGDLTVLPIAARELVQYGVDLIFTSEEHATKVLQSVTHEVPIVFTAVNDPVGLGLIESFAHPGGNITGVADLAVNLGPKRLQIFHELLPNLKRVLYLYDAGDAQTKTEVRVYRNAARRLGIALVEKGVRTVGEAQAFLRTVREAGIDGILAPRCCSLNLPGLILEANTQQGIPAMFEAAFWADQGGLASYGVDYYASGKQAARLVGKILQGTKPGDLPVEVNSKIEFAINLKTVKKLGLSIAPEVLFRADKLVR